jgi:nucleotide-binding universal stress UspA family protein
MLEFTVNIDTREIDSTLIRFAFGLARQYNAHLTGLQIVALDTTSLVLPDALIALDEEEHDANGRRDWWRELCRGHGVDGSWEVVRDYYQNAIARQASLSDLMIGRLSAKDTFPLLGLNPLSRSLFEGGIPMLLVPEAWASHPGVQKVAIAWNGSVEAARAVKTALPLLRKAEKITVLDGEDVSDTGKHRASLPLREWLERQHLPVQWQSIDAVQGNGKAIHEQVKAMGADLLVMGAWGHSRMSEWILGGITRYMLQHSDVPLLLAH